MKFLLILIAASVSIANGNAYFQHLGWVNAAPSYGHIHMVINTDTIQNQLKNVGSGIELMKKTIENLQHTNVKRRATAFFQKATTDLYEINIDFNGFRQLIEETHENTQRSKRFLGLMVALGALSLGTFNRADLMLLHNSVSNIAMKQDHIIDILQEHEVSIHKVQHDMQTIKKALEMVINTTEENYAMTVLHDSELQIIMALNEMRRTMVCLQHGLERLLSKRLPTCFLEPNQMKKSMANLQKKATQLHMEVVSDKAMAMLEYEVSILIIKGTIHIFTHVPLWETTQQLELLKFSNTPVEITDDLSLRIVSQEKYLAIGKDGIHATLTTSEFSELQEFGTKFFATSALILSKNINTTCLGAIFSQNLKVVKEECTVMIEHQSETLIAISKNKYVLHAKKPQTIEITCNSKTQHKAVNRIEHLTLEQGCKISTENHVLFAGHTVMQEEKIHVWPLSWAVDKLFDLNKSELDRVVKELKQIYNKPTTVRNLHQLMANYSSFPTHQQQNIILTCIIIFVAIGICCIIGFLARRYKANSHRAVEAENDP